MKRLLFSLAPLGLLLLVLVLYEGINSWRFGSPPPSDAVQRLNQCQLRQLGEQEGMLDCTPGDEEDTVVPLKPGDRPRVVFLGGSSVRPYEQLGTGESFPDVLARWMPELEVLNFGVTGLHAAGIAALARDLELLQPDLVVLYTGHNDYNGLVFRGQIQGARLWLLPWYQLLERSWLHATLFRKPLAGSVTDRARHDNRVMAISDDFALQVRPEVGARFQHDLSLVLEELEAPVLLCTLLRNPMVPPTGTLVPQGSSCDQQLKELEAASARVSRRREQLSQQHCGEGALTAWHRAHRLRAEGDAAGAAQAWHQSLDSDVIPMRAPASADEIIRALAEREGVQLVDLEREIGPMAPGSYFVDTLHFSREGAEAVARELQPHIQTALSP